MLSLFAWPALLAGHQETIELRDGLAIGGLGSRGRQPVVMDPIAAKLIRGEPVEPIAGDTVTAGTQTHLWRSIHAAPDGHFEGNALNGGYLYATYDASEDMTRILVASGDTMVYVNGEPRPGDPYSTGYVRFPVALHKGTNEFLFATGRGTLSANLVRPSAPYQLDTGDLTLPDSVGSDTGNLFGGIIILNSTPEDALDLSIACAADGKDIVTPLPRIPAVSFRKVRFDFPAGATDLDLVLMRNGAPIHSAHVIIEARKEGDAYKRTFESSIDGSVQYYAVRPSSLPDKGNALILSLHGAGVEAFRQASAYSGKPWATLVAPTNRRPYGFDWEDWGRMDGMEVLDIAGATIPHDPKRVVVTGHSMGGHGTWSFGTLYPSRFGATAPSAGWISFWSYAGGWEPTDASAPEAMLRRSMSPSDTLARVQNLAAESVYILHGDQDETVPLAQARKMRSTLAQLGIDFGYHEEPGAGHWWGDKCMDYPDLMTALEGAHISDFKTIDFTTPDPGISSECGWVKVLQQVHPRLMSHIKGDADGLVTENVRALQIESDLASLKLDGQVFQKIKAGTVFLRPKDAWKTGNLSPTSRRAEFCGPVKHAFNERFVFVYGTSGTPEENRWGRDKARFDAESFYVKGNGAVETVADVDYVKGDFRNRNPVLFGNADTNRVWKALLGRAPIRLRRGELRVGAREFKGGGYGAMFVYPAGSQLVVGIGGTGPAGMRINDRMPVFTSGVAYPDWTIFGPETIEKGTKGIAGAGYFGPDWGLEDGDLAWLAAPAKL